MYLSQVQISDFRAFPPDFSLDIHAGPGVTLLVGQNGLGKSTFIEAVEWALTGTVRRLADLSSKSKNADYLKRRSADGEQVNGYSVSLRFGNETEGAATVMRALRPDATGEEAASGTSPQQIVDLLRSAVWQEPISDIAQYLRLTHFLSQSVEQRFAAKEPNARWNALEAPAGTERLNFVRERLGSGGLTRAFNRREQEALESIRVATAALAQWEDLLQRRETLRKLLGTSGGSNPSEIAPAINELVREANALSPGSVDVNSAGLANQHAILQVAGETLRMAAREVLERRSRADAAKDLPQEWIECVNNRERLRVLSENQNKAIAEATTSFGIRQSSLAEALSMRESAIKSERAARERLVVAHSKLSARQELGRVRQQASQSMVLESSSEKALSDASSKLASANNAVIERQKLDQDWLNARAKTNELNDARRRVAALTAITEEGSQLTATHTEWLKTILELRSSLKVQRTVLDELSRRADEAESAAELLRQKGSAILGAVSVIAAHLSEADCLCPVCSTAFQPGELRNRVANTAFSADKVLSSLETTIKETRDSARLAASRIRQQESDLAKAEGALRVVSGQREETAARRTAVVTVPVLQGISEENFISFLEGRVKEALANQVILETKRNAVDSVDDIQTEATKRNIEFQASQSRLEEAKRQVDSNRSRIAQLEAILLSESAMAAVPDVDELQAIEQSVIREVSAAEEVLWQCEAKLTAALKDETIAKAERDSLRAALDASQRELGASNALTQAILARWRGIGLKDEPSASSLSELLATVDQREIRIRRAVAMHSDLVDRLELWQRAVELRELEMQIDRISNTDSVTADRQTEWLKIRITAAQEHVDAIRAASDYKDRIVKTLQKESTKYTSEVLQPINQLNAAFLKMFSCFSDFTVSLNARTQKANVQLELMVNWLSSQKTRSNQVSVREYLSEGQLSALSVGLLFSMSSMYRWSNWRALLLDDPLQHNDVIHAAAFIEVLRGLVRYEGYQVILSTHDLALADYIRRKLIAANINCNTCQFLGIGASGVLHENS